ncbi:MAG: DUF2090 domain-containing protein [Candidatus Devosia euplotis]|nr:DUF2090 domain-containing protein [Candidatus Devosia euplotis]
MFAEAAKAWLAGRITDEDAVADMAGRFGAIVTVWQRLGDSRAT